MSWHCAKILINSLSATVELCCFRTTDNLTMLVLLFWENITVLYLIHSTKLGVCASKIKSYWTEAYGTKMDHNKLLLLQGCGYVSLTWSHITVIVVLISRSHIQLLEGINIVDSIFLTSQRPKMSLT